MDQRACPSAVELLEYITGVVDPRYRDVITAHLAHCDACRIIVKAIQAAEWKPDLAQGDDERPARVPADLRLASAAGVDRFKKASHQPQPLRARFGQIWATSPVSDSTVVWGETRLVVALGEEADGALTGRASLSVAPISLDLAYQSDRDLLVPAEASPLGYPFMIEVWNEVVLLRPQLLRCLGVLDQPFKRSLGLLYQVQLGAGIDLNLVSQHLGPAITSADDPRVGFQEQEVEACEYLRAPLLADLAVAQYDGSHRPPEDVVLQNGVKGAVIPNLSENL